MTNRRMTLEEFERELKLFYRRKKKARHRYSIRAMSIELNMNHSTLHKLITGDRRLGYLMARELAGKFGVEIDHEKAPRRKRQKVSALRLLDPQSSTHLSWLNLAILEMIRLHDFTATTEWVAKRLEMPESTIQEAVSRMETAGMLRREPGTWIDLLEDASANATGLITTSLIRKAIKDLLTVSQSKLDELPADEREHALSVFPMSQTEMTKMKKKIFDFQESLVTQAQRARTPKNRVYALQIGLFPLTTSSVGSSK